jgi:hypothetical protein
MKHVAGGDMKTVQTFTQFGKNILFVSFGTFIIHLVVKAMSLAIMSRDFFAVMNIKFFIELFSLQMIPNIISYGFLIAAVYYLFQKTRDNIEKIHENELQIEREQAVRNTMQKVTGIMAEFISSHNSEITRWIDDRRRSGQQPSERVVEANRKIGIALETLSNVSFVLPYMKEGHEDPERFLQEKLLAIEVTQPVFPARQV